MQLILKNYFQVLKILFQSYTIIFSILSYQKLKEGSKIHTLMSNLSLRINS